jgi:hypothetical protein
MTTDKVEIIPGVSTTPKETIALEVAITSFPETQTNAPLSQMVSAWLVPTIAISAVFIAFGQLVINRKRLRHELFDRRYKMYDAALHLISGSFDKDLSYSHIDRFTKDTKGARFIFSMDIEIYFEHLLNIAIELMELSKEIKYRTSEKELMPREDRIGEILEQFNAELHIIDEIFEPYLGINK